MLGAIVGVIVFAGEWFRYRQGWSNAFDLGIFDQMSWLLAHDHGQVSLIQRNVFADHLAPVMMVFGLAYKIHATVLWLFAAQALASGAAVVPLRRLARRQSVPMGVATVAILGYAPVLAALYYDFHTSTLALPAVAWLVVGAYEGNTRLTTVAGLAVIACRVDLAIVLLAVAIIADPTVRRPLLAVTACSLALLAVSPAAGSHGLWSQDYGYLGAGPIEALLHPWRVAVGLGRPAALLTMAIWLVPVGLLPIRRPRWLLAVIIAGMPALLLGPTRSHAPWFHYGAPIAPLVLGAFFAAYDRRWRLPPMPLLAAGLTLGLTLSSPLSPSVPASLSLWHIGQRGPGADIRMQLSRVGRHDVVSAPPEVVPYLAERQWVYAYPLPFRSGEPEGGRASALHASRVEVVIAPAAEEVRLAELGFGHVLFRDGRYVMARR